MRNEFWVLQRLFKAIIAVIDWADYAGLIGYQGPQQPANMDPAPLQLRWLLHPALGLPLSPFTVWHNVHPGGSPTPQELADLPNWEPIEQVGLPVDASWRDTGYGLSDQGPVGAPLLSPVDAAHQRLQLGAPRIGWPGVTVNGTALPDWAPPDLDAYLVDVLRGALLGGIQQMLTDRPDPSQHADYLLNAGDGNGSGSLNPHLLGDASVVGAPDQPASAAWHPLGLLLLAAGTDPLASLCLGFGTATRRYEFEGDIYMVSVRHKLRIGPEVLELQLADVVVPGEQPAPPVPPQAVAAALLGHTRAQTTDGPAIDTAQVSWQRPSNPSFGHLPPGSPRPVSYALGRFDSSRASQILLSPRPEAVHGWQPFAPTKPDEDGPAGFTDHLVREATVDGQVYGQPLGEDHTYAVAAADLFGRFSGWSTVAYTDEDESPPTPPVLSVSLDPSGGLSIDFGWDWSTRSPEFIDLSGAFAEDPGTPLVQVRLQFAGNPDPDTGGGDIIPLSPDLVEVATFGDAQDDDASPPETRFYRLRATLPGVVFGAATEKVFQVQARGQCHLTEMMLPGWGVSPWGTPVTTTVRDPSPPPAPGGIPEAPQWASTPDTSGVSRAVLGWAGVQNVSGYVLYEATETALLGALSLPGPDPSRSYVDRLADLRGRDLPSLRQVFRRVVQDLIPATSYEVELPPREHGDAPVRRDRDREQPGRVELPELEPRLLRRGRGPRSGSGPPVGGGRSERPAWSAGVTRHGQRRGDTRGVADRGLPNHRRRDGTQRGHDGSTDRRAHAGQRRRAVRRHNGRQRMEPGLVSRGRLDRDRRPAWPRRDAFRRIQRRVGTRAAAGRARGLRPDSQRTRVDRHRRAGQLEDECAGGNLTARPPHCGDHGRRRRAGRDARHGRARLGPDVRLPSGASTRGSRQREHLPRRDRHQLPPLRLATQAGRRPTVRGQREGHRPPWPVGHRGRYARALTVA